VSIGRYEGISSIIQDFETGKGSNVSISGVVDNAAVAGLHNAITPPKTAAIPK
jgi:hypothetical protein